MKEALNLLTLLCLIFPLSLSALSSAGVQAKAVTARASSVSYSRAHSEVAFYLPNHIRQQEALRPDISDEDSLLTRKAVPQNSDPGWSIIISVTSLIVSIAVAVFVYARLALFRRQLRFKSLMEITSINRELIILGLENPDMFDTLEGGSLFVDNNLSESAQREKRFLQLWLNQFYIVWLAHNLSLYSEDEWQAHKRDMYGTLSNSNMQNHWERVREYYPDNFRQFVDNVIEDTQTEVAANNDE